MNARARLQQGLVWLTVGAATWAIEVWARDGFTIDVLGVSVSAHHPAPGLIVAVGALAGWMAMAGVVRVRGLVDQSLRRLSRAAGFALCLACATAIVGVWLNTGTGAGSDSYGYVSQADLWVAGHLRTTVSAAADVPWPNGLGTFTPLGYDLSPDGAAFVPTYSPGLPLLMALAKVLAGHAAMFWVVPLSGGLLVWLTFVLGRTLSCARVGVAAASLVSVSPVMLFMLLAPMSDVPAAAFWALATVCVIGASMTSTIVAGCVASIAILIRPNLAPVAAAIALWLLWRDVRLPLTHRFRRVVVFGLCTAPGVLAVAWLNNALYGSPARSGYGTLGHLFSSSYVPENVATYGAWLIDAETPIVIAGLLVLCLPFLRVWRTPDARGIAGLLGLVAFSVLGMYLIYQPWDAWWYLRFLLPAWPAMFIGTAFVLHRLLPAERRSTRVAFVVAIGGLVAHGAVVSQSRHVFAQGDGERKYVTAAHLVRAFTDDNAVILTMQHSGSVRYYGRRNILRYDQLDPAWLDRAVEWLQSRGVHPYVLLESWERQRFRRRFQTTNRAGRLAMSPTFVYDGPGMPTLYDLLAPDGPPERAPLKDVPLPPQFARPDPAPPLVLRPRR